MLNYKYIGNLNDYIVENLYHEAINQYKLIEKDFNLTNENEIYNKFVLKIENINKEFKIKKTINIKKFLKTPGARSLIKRPMTPGAKAFIKKLRTPGAPKRIKNNRTSQISKKYLGSIQKRLFNQLGGESNVIYKKYIENLYLYDNHHDFHGNSRGDKILASDLLLLNSKKINNGLSTTEKTFFIKALDDLNNDNPSLFMKYYFIKNSNAKNIFSNRGNNLENINIEDFKNYLNNNLNFVNNRIIYDGNVTNLSPDLKRIRNIIEEYKQEITAEIIFDPMNTKNDHYKEMNKNLKILSGEYLDKYSDLSDSVFNSGNDSTSAFNNDTRKLFNIVYYKKNDNNYSVALLFINKDRCKGFQINNTTKNFLKNITKKDGKYIEQQQTDVNKDFIALDIVYLHITSKKNEEINSVKNIKDMIYHIYNDNISSYIDTTFKYYLVNYLYQKKEEKTQAIDILFDLKKAGDYGKVLLCHYNNIKYNDIKYLLSTNDTLCALNGILRKNINVVFGTTENGEKNLSFYACCNDNYNVQYAKNIIESTFKDNIDTDKYKDIDNIKEIDTIENAKIINDMIDNIKIKINEKYNEKINTTLRIYYNDKNKKINITTK